MPALLVMLLPNLAERRARKNPNVPCDQGCTWAALFFVPLFLLGAACSLLLLFLGGRLQLAAVPMVVSGQA
jgi:hypothetical protein